MAYGGSWMSIQEARGGALGASAASFCPLVVPLMARPVYSHR